MKKLVFAIVLALVLWTLMFSPQLSVVGDMVSFWWLMTISATSLTMIAFLSNGKYLKKSLATLNYQQVLLGIVIAVVIWFVFFIGDKVSSWFFPFARTQVNSIYSLKDSDPHWLISILLLLLIGPGEELFWRGFIQQKLSRRYTANKGFWVALLFYTLVHLPSCNFMLIMAAFVCGFIWGGLYRIYPRCFPAIVISHALWDAAVFIWFPI